MANMKSVSAVLLIFLVSFFGLITFSTPAVSSPDEVEWSRANIPAEGNSNGWMLANGSDVKLLRVARDGTLYAYANPSGTSYTLFKSTTDGDSWSHTGTVEDEIVDIAIDPDHENTVYYATASDIYKSADAGESFRKLPLIPGGAGSNNIEITTIDVMQLDGNNLVTVATKDNDNLEYGGSYLLEEDEEQFFSWVDMDIGSYDVYDISFSPNFADDAMLIAVVTDQAHTYVTYNYGTTGDWAEVELLSATSSSFTITAASNIAFPDDFNEPDTLFVGVVGGNGGVYQVDEAHSERLNDIDTDIISLAVAGQSGNINLLAGENDSSEVWYSTDGGDSWDSTTKAPSGSGPTHVVMTEDFIGNGRAYAATSSSESAVSVTLDGSVTWNQIGLIDTTIDAIIDLAPAPNDSEENSLFMLTWGGEHSLWRSPDEANKWERVFSSTLPEVNSLSQVELSPQYGIESQVVFLAGTSEGNPVIWKSADNGQTFSHSGRAAPYPIDIWAVVNDTTLFIGSYDGSNGLVYRSTNSGRSYSAETVVGSEPLSSIALSPNYEQDETILIGNTNGWVYLSQDDGTFFEPLPPDATLPPFTGSVTVAFDPEFESNDTVYAASSSPDEGVYRFILGNSTKWENIDRPAGGMPGQLAVSADGTLYATSFETDGGMERSLNPTYSLGPTFETVTRGLDDGAALINLWLRGNRLWSIDTTNVKLMTFTDSLTLPVTLTSPADTAPGIGNIINDMVRDVSLDWETLSGATEYEWQLNDNASFSDTPATFEGAGGASSVKLPELEIATTYYWRVRASEPILSPWSDKWSFTTTMGSAATGPELISPEAGATGVLTKPIFQWSAMSGAESYEFIMSTEASFDNPAILKIGDYALPATAWECNIELDHDTTYYWKVRAVNAETYSDLPPVISPPSKLVLMPLWLLEQVADSAKHYAVGFDCTPCAIAQSISSLRQE